MPTKPVVAAIETWASAASFPASVFPVGHPKAGLPTPWSGAPTKDPAQASVVAANGHEPAIPTEATGYNDILNRGTQLLEWVRLGESATTAQAALVEKDSSGVARAAQFFAVGAAGTVGFSGLGGEDSAAASFTGGPLNASTGTYGASGAGVGDGAGYLGSSDNVGVGAGVEGRANHEDAYGLLGLSFPAGIGGGSGVRGEGRYQSQPGVWGHNTEATTNGGPGVLAESDIGVALRLKPRDTAAGAITTKLVGGLWFDDKADQETAAYIEHNDSFDVSRTHVVHTSDGGYLEAMGENASTGLNAGEVTVATADFGVGVGVHAAGASICVHIDGSVTTNGAAESVDLRIYEIVDDVGETANLIKTYTLPHPGTGTIVDLPFSYTHEATMPALPNGSSRIKYRFRAERVGAAATIQVDNGSVNARGSF